MLEMCIDYKILYVKNFCLNVLNYICICIGALLFKFFFYTYVSTNVCFFFKRFDGLGDIIIHRDRQFLISQSLVNLNCWYKLIFPFLVKL